jgi:hypothetical protein
MPNLQRQYSGTDYAQIAARMFMDADRVNGRVLVPDPQGGVYYPRLTNAQVAAIVRAWKRAAARSSAPSWPVAYDLTIEALGWQKAGDRFDMSDAHMRAAADPTLLAYMWESIDRLGKDLDGSRTKLAPVIVDWSKEGYEQAARDAWQDMQAHGSANNPIPPKKPPAAPAVQVKAPPPSSAGGMGALLVLIALYLMTKRRS